MGLNIYFLDNDVEDVEYQEHLGITHNLNKIVDYRDGDWVSSEEVIYLQGA